MLAGCPEELEQRQWDGVQVLLIENPEAEDTPAVPWLPDEAFLRGKAPMTKEEIREVALCKLRLKKDLLVACIIRDNRVIFPSGNDCIQPRDGVIVVTTRETLEGLNDILA